MTYGYWLFLLLVQEITKFMYCLLVYYQLSRRKLKWEENIISFANAHSAMQNKKLVLSFEFTFQSEKKRRRRNRTFYCLFPQLIYLDCYSLCIIDIVDVISLSQMIRLSICLIHILMTCPISKLYLQQKEDEFFLWENMNR